MKPVRSASYSRFPEEFVQDADSGLRHNSSKIEKVGLIVSLFLETIETYPPVVASANLVRDRLTAVSVLKDNPCSPEM